MRSRAMTVAAALAALLLTAATAHAQTPPPARNANIWSGTAHQPRRDDVDGAERKVGGSDRSIARRQDDAVDDVGRQLEDLENHYPPGFLQPQPR